MHFPDLTPSIMYRSAASQMQVLSHTGRFVAHIAITRLSVHLIRDRREPLPALAKLLGLYG
jgi:hypothetical protein